MQYARLKRYYALKREVAEMIEREPTEDEMNDALADDPNFGNGFTARDFETFEIEKDEEDEVELRFRMGVSNMNLVKARMEKGLKQIDVALMLGFTTPSSYGQIENCHQYPSEEVQEKLVAILGKKKAYLFPEWLEVFTNKWKRSEKEKTVKLRAESLSSPEVAGLISAPSSMQLGAERELLKAKIAPMLDRLNPRERKILEMRFGLVDGIAHDLEEVGREFDVTRERIRHIEAHALEKIQQMPEMKHLNQFSVHGL